jgi:hypothetical protein
LLLELLLLQLQLLLLVEHVLLQLQQLLHLLHLHHRRDGGHLGGVGLRRRGLLLLLLLLYNGRDELICHGTNLLQNTTQVDNTRLRLRLKLRLRLRLRLRLLLLLLHHLLHCVRMYCVMLRHEGSVLLLLLLLLLLLPSLCPHRPVILPQLNSGASAHACKIY